MEPLHDAAEGIPLAVGSGIFKTVGTQRTHAGTENHRKTSYQVIVIGIDILVAHCIAVSVVREVPIRRVGLLRRFHRADVLARISRFRRIVDFHRIRSRTSVSFHLFHVVVAVGIYAGAVRTRLEHGSSFVVALRRTSRNLNERLNQIAFAISVRIEIRLHIHAEPNDIGRLRIVRVSGLSVSKRKYRLCHAVLEHRHKFLAVHRHIISSYDSLQFL